jgi:hypothetical protein
LSSATYGFLIVFSINQNTQRALDPNSSDFWPSLFSILSRNSDSCNMTDAILVAMKFKHICPLKKSYMFVLTDGQFPPHYHSKLRNVFGLCKEYSIHVFEIGLGYFRSGILSLFAQCLWPTNSNLLISALSVFF